MSVLQPSNSTPAARPGRSLAVLAFGLGSFFAASSAPTPLYRLYQQDWGFSSGMLTLVFAVYALSLLLALLTTGALSDHLGRKPVILAALVLEIVSLAVFALAGDVQALVLARVLQGFATGMAPGEIVKNLTNGAGKTLGAVGVVIALGAMLGKILADSGTTERLASAILQRTSERMIPWAMTLVAFVIGIPMFFEVGLVVMLPLIFSVARKLESNERFKGSAYVYVGVPVIAALAAMHGMVPPHPGPLTAIATLHTTVGPTMLLAFWP